MFPPKEESEAKSSGLSLGDSFFTLRNIKNEIGDACRQKDKEKIIRKIKELEDLKREKGL